MGRSLAGALVALAASAAASAAGSDAILARLAPQSLLLGIASAGARLVAVGERGHVLYSDDRGGSWTQAALVPTRATLTAVCFHDARDGWAVGHDETILATHDAGEHWTNVHFAPETQQPLLEVWCGSSGRSIAVGAYGAMYVTDDGAHWSARKLEAKPLAAAARAGAAAGPAAPAATATAADAAAGPPPDYHLNAIVGDESRLYIAAESGHLYRSADAGADWLTLPSPYEGSFYGLLPLGGDELLAFGLRGRLFRSRDAGLTWERVESHTDSTLDAGVRLADGTIVVAGLDGALLVSRDAGASFQLRQQSDRRGIAALAVAGHGEVVAVGEGGAKRVAIAPPGEPP